jgi:predicted sugar kinase
VFRLGYGRIGPTEARLALAGLNVVLFAGVTLDTRIAGLGVSVLDAGGLVVAAGMVATLCVRATKNLRILAEREPAGRPSVA